MLQKRLQAESLEPRVLLAGDITASFSHLTTAPTVGDDTIKFADDWGSVTIDAMVGTADNSTAIRGGADTFSFAAVPNTKPLQITLGQGDNSFAAQQGVNQAFADADFSPTKVLAGRGNDVIAIENRASLQGTLNGGAGIDLLNYSPESLPTARRVDVNLSQANRSIIDPSGGADRDLKRGEATGLNRGNSQALESFEIVIGGRRDDTLFGKETGLDNRLAGAAGNDFIVGGAQSDLLIGGGNGAPGFIDSLRQYSLPQAPNDDFDFKALLSADTNRGKDTLIGLAGNDVLIGGLGDNHLDGGPGNDLMGAGTGDDTYYFENNWGADEIVDLGGEDRLDFSGVLTPLTYTIDETIDGLKFTITDGTNANRLTSTIDHAEIVLGATLGPEQSNLFRPTALPTSPLTIGESEQTATWDLDFGEITDDLTFTIREVSGPASNRVVVTRVLPNGQSEEVFDVYGVNDLTGGKGHNTYEFVGNAQLQGNLVAGTQDPLNPAATKNNTLDYSAWTGNVFANLTTTEVVLDAATSSVQKFRGSTPVSTPPVAADKGVLPIQATWELKVAGLSGVMTLGFGDSESRLFSFEDDQNPTLSAEESERLRNIDQQEFRRELSKLIDRSDFTVVKNQDRNTTITSWAIRFPQPKSLGAETTTALGALTAQVSHRVNVSADRRLGVEDLKRQTVSFPTHDQAGSLQLKYGDQVIDVNLTDLNSEDSTVARLEAARIERWMGLLDSTLDRYNIFPLHGVSESTGAHEWGVRFEAKTDTPQPPFKFEYVNTTPRSATATVVQQGRVAIDETWDVFTKATGGTFTLEVQFVDLDDAIVEVQTDPVPYNASPEELQEALMTAIADQRADFIAGGLPIAWEIDPQVVVNGQGTETFPWRITLGNMGEIMSVTVDGLLLESLGQEHGLATPDRIPPNWAMGLSEGKTVTQVSKIVGSKTGEGDLIYGSSSMQGEITNFSGVSGQTLQGDFTLVVQRDLDLETGQAVLYRAERPIAGLVDRQIYFVKVTKETVANITATKLNFYSTAEDVRSTSPARAIKLGESGDFAGSLHRLYQVGAIDSLAEDDRLTAPLVDGMQQQGNRLSAGDGNDVLTGSNGSDLLSGDRGNDILFGDGRHEQVVGNAAENGVDILSGGPGDDQIFGMDGPDRIDGGANNDTLVGGKGSDDVQGGAGNDTLKINELGSIDDYDRLDGGGGDDTYEFVGTWGVADIVETSGLRSNDLIDLTSTSDSYVHVLDHGNLFSVPGTLINEETEIDKDTKEVTNQGSSHIRVYDPLLGEDQSPIIPLHTALEDLGDFTPSPGRILTEWGFGLHQTATGSTLLPGSTGVATLTAFDAPLDIEKTLGELDVRLWVDRGDGPRVYDVHLDRFTYTDLSHLSGRLTASIIEAVPGVDDPGELESKAGIKVETVGDKLQITAKPIATTDANGKMIPAKIEWTATARNSIVSNDLSHIEGIKTSGGANTFVFGNDYWSGGLASTAGSVAQATPLVGKLLRGVQDTITVDTQKIVDNQSPLTLDFRSVNYELFFDFEPIQDDADSVKLTVYQVLDTRIGGSFVPFSISGATVRANKIVFSKVNRDTTIYGGRFKNTFQISGNAEFKGHLIGGEGTGLLTQFAGRYSDQLSLAREVIENLVFENLSRTNELGVGASLLNSLFYSVSNTLQYSGTLFTQTNVNQETLRLAENGREQQLATQALFGNVAPFTFDRWESTRTTDGFSGLTENASGSAGIGEVVFGSGLGSLNIARGTDYDFRDVTANKDFSTALSALDGIRGSLNDLVSSGSDTLRIGDGIAPSVGLHVLAGGSGADTYKFDTTAWGAALVVDDLFDVQANIGPLGALVPTDTLDFSAIQYPLHYTVFRLSSNDIPAVQELNKGTGFLDSVPLSVGTSMVVVTPDPIYEEALGSFEDFIRTVAATPNVVIAFGIDNIVGGKSTNEFTFVDGGSVSGSIEPGFGGSLALNYDSYHGLLNSDTDGVSVDFSAGGDRELIAASVFSGADFGFLQPYFPNVTFQFGNATGTGNGDLGVAVGGDIIGTDFADKLYGNNITGNVIHAGNGEDDISGRTGNDRLFGEGGSDYIRGGPEEPEDNSLNASNKPDDDDDILFGGAGNDYLLGGYGRDILVGGPDGDIIDGGADHDIYVPGTSASLLTFPKEQAGDVARIEAAAARLDRMNLQPLDVGVEVLGLDFVQPGRHATYAQRIVLQDSTLTEFGIQFNGESRAILTSAAADDSSPFGIKQRLESVPGIATVEVLGGTEGVWHVRYSGITAELSGSLSADPSEAEVTDRELLEAAQNQKLTVSRVGQNVGDFTLRVGPETTEAIPFFATIDQIQLAVQSAIGPNYAVTVQGEGSNVHPWEIEFQNIAPTTTTNELGVQVESARALMWGSDLVEVDLLSSTVEEIRINSVIDLGEGETKASVVPDKAAFFTEDDSSQTLNINPIDLGENLAYTVLMDDTDQLNFKGVGVERTTLGAYANDQQTLTFYTDASKTTTVLTLHIEGLGRAVTTDDVNLTKATTLLANQPSVSGSPVAAFDLTANALKPIRVEAVSRWLAATVNDAEVTEVLNGIEFTIEDLPGRALAQASGQSVRIDVDAAGQGWFVDATPHLDSEFSLDGAGDSRRADVNSAAYAKYDLLTVISHEIGHVLGLPHDNADGALMHHSLTAGTRSYVTADLATEIEPGFAHAGHADGDPLTDEEKILGGLDSFATWADGLGTELMDSITDISLPFVELNLADVLNAVDVVDATGNVQQGINLISSRIGEAIRSQIVDVFQGPNDVTTGSLLALPAIDVSAANLLTEFEANLELASSTRNLNLSLQTLADLGLDLTGFVDLEVLELETALNLRFGFGLDSGSGEFFIEDPTLVGRVTLSHADPLNATLDFGPIGIGIEDGTVFFQAGIVLPTEGRYGVADLSSLEIVAPEFDPQSSYEIDLPLKLQGALAGLADDPVRIHTSLNRDGDGTAAVERLTASQFFATVPETLTFEGDVFDAMLDLKDISLDAALSGIESALRSAISEDGAAYQDLPFINQSAVELLGDDSVNIVDQIIDGIGEVRSNLSDINRFEIDLNQTLHSKLGLVGLNLDGSNGGNSIDDAYDDLVAVSTSLTSQSSDDALAIALAESDDATSDLLDGLRTDRDVVAANDRLTPLVLDGDSTNRDIALILAQQEAPVEFANLQADRDLVAGDDAFLQSWLRLEEAGLPHDVSDVQIEIFYDTSEAVTQAIQHRDVVLDTNATEDEQTAARIQLSYLGVAAESTDAEIFATFDRDQEIASAKADRDIVIGRSQNLFDAAIRLQTLGLSGEADDQDLANAVVAADTQLAYRADRDLLQETGNDPGGARLRLQNAGLTYDSTDGDLARTLVDATELAQLIVARDILANYDALKSVELEYADSVLDLRIGMTKAIDTNVDLAFDSNEQTFLDNVLSNDVFGLKLSGDGQVHVNADVDFDLNFTFDLSSLGSPEFIIYDDSQITFNTLEIETLDPLQFTAQFDVAGAELVSFVVKDATIDVDLTGTISLVEDSQDQQYFISELVSDASLWNVDLLGTIEADLPIFFPTSSVPFGGSDADENGDGYPDHVVHVDGEFRGENDYDVNVVMPSFGLDRMFPIFEYLNDPGNVLDGFEAIFDTLADAGGNLTNLNLPLIGDQLDNAAEFVTEMRTDFLGDNSSGQYVNGFGKTLEDGIQNDQTMIELLQVGIFNLNEDFKTSNGFDLLKAPVLDGNGNYTFDASGVLQTSSLARPEDVQFRLTDTGLQFNVVMQNQIYSTQIPLQFDGGVPGFSLESDATLDLDFSYTFGLGFGFDVFDGFYLDTTGITPDGAELSVNLSASIPGADISGTLGFLQVQLTDSADDDGASGLFGSFEVDLVSSGGNRWRPLVHGDTLSLDVALNLAANIDLDVAVNMAALSDIGLPRIDTTVRYDQTLVKLSTSGGSTIGGTPIVQFADVKLDLGSLISDFAGPVIDNVSSVTSRLEPLVEVLTEPIDLLVELGLEPEEASLLAVAETILSSTKYASVVRGIEAVEDVIDFAHAIQQFRENANQGPIMVDFGTFTLTGDDAPETTPPEGRFSPSSQATGNARGVMNRIGKSPGSFRFPLLENPSAMLGLLTGSEDVTLFEYDMPAIDLDFQWVFSFQLIPPYPVNGRLGGGVAATTNFTFGFDTRGLNDWKAQDFDPFQSALFLDGFFLSDHIETIDAPEATVSVRLIAGTSIGVANVLEAAVDGDITASIFFDLNDVLSDPLGPTDNDNKITWSELRDHASRGPLCIFDMSGEITTGLTASVSGLVFNVSRELARAKIADFNISSGACGDGDPPQLVREQDVEAGQVTKLVNRSGEVEKYERAKNGVIHLNLGDTANDRGADYNEAKVGKDERVEIRRANAPDGTEVTQLFFAGHVLEYTGVTKIIASGGDGNDELIVHRDVTADVEFHGGIGEDTLVYRGDGVARLFGDDGADELRGGEQSDHLDGGDGPDVISGWGGNDTILGGPGDDQISGWTGEDNIDAGPGNDHADGGDDTDTIVGGPGMDMLIGGDGPDNLIGGEDDDTYVWQNGTVPDVITEAGASTGDELFVQGGSANQSGAVAVSSNDNLVLRRGTGGLPEVVGTTTQSFNNIEKVTLAVGSGADTVTVEDLSATIITAVGIDLGQPNDGADTVFINGTSDADSFTLQGKKVAGSAAAGTIDVVHLDWNALPIQIVGGNPARDNLLLLGNAGTDEFTIVPNAHALRVDEQLMVTMDGGADDDTFTTPYVEVEIVGGGGTNSLFFTGNTAIDRPSVSLSTDPSDNRRGAFSVELPTENLIVPFREMTNLTMMLTDSGGGETVTVHSNILGMLEIIGGVGDDIVNVESLRDGGGVTAAVHFGAGGGNQLTLGNNGSLALLGSGIRVQGGPGPDQVTFDNRTDATPRSATVQQDGVIGLPYEGLEIRMN